MHSCFRDLKIAHLPVGMVIGHCMCKLAELHFVPKVENLLKNHLGVHILSLIEQGKTTAHQLEIRCVENQQSSRRLGISTMFAIAAHRFEIPSHTSTRDLESPVFR